ncbi:hypothetical protein F5Y03DRAFT_269055 [Xylaria venustula]|nr:hypothetical protein F5Y03DRAFT_269055 [Xylaria venustula]
MSLTPHLLTFPSPRNSAAAHKVLLDTLGCKTLITTTPISPPALTILKAAQSQMLTVPEVDQLLGQAYQHYSCDRTYEKNGREPIWAIHTSGSTGFPKPIIWTSEAIARHHNGTDAAPPASVPSLDHFERGKRVLTTLPPFHVCQLIFRGVSKINIVRKPAWDNTSSGAFRLAVPRLHRWRRQFPLPMDWWRPSNKRQPILHC